MQFRRMIGNARGLAHVGHDGILRPIGNRPPGSTPQGSVDSELIALPWHKAPALCPREARFIRSPEAQALSRPRKPEACATGQPAEHPG